MQNAASIALLGILSYNQLQRLPELDKLSVSIADPFVNRRRHRRQINGRSLHDFVPLYWATHTPMQYVDTVKNGTLPEDDLVFFVLDAGQVLTLPGVMTTDGNAASKETVVCEGLGALLHLDLGIIRTPDCYSHDWKRRKCAEVLVPDRVPTDKISYIAVRTDEVASQLRSTLKTVTDELKKADIPHRAVSDVRVCRMYYYNLRSGLSHGRSPTHRRLPPHLGH